MCARNAALPAQRVERHAIETGSLLVAGHPDGTLAGGARVLDGLRGVPGVTCGDEVVGELREVRVAVIRVQCLECLADFTVQAETTRATELPVQAVTNQDVGEAQPGGGSRNLRQHVPPQSLPERVQQLLLTAPAHVRQRPEVELPPEHGRERKRAPAIRGEVPQAPADHFAGRPGGSEALPVPPGPTSPRRPSVESSRTTSPMKSGLPSVPW